jgi:hypothetical protein
VRRVAFAALTSLDQARGVAAPDALLGSAWLKCQNAAVEEGAERRYNGRAKTLDTMTTAAQAASISTGRH